MEGHSCDLNINFIVKPLAELHRHSTLDNPEVYAILERRFQRTYNRHRDFDEKVEFRTDTSFVEGIKTASPESLAKSITEDDLRLFHHCLALTLLGKNGWIFVGRSWNNRSQDTSDCLNLDSKYGSALVQLAIVSQFVDPPPLAVQDN